MPDNHRETRADRLGYIQSMLGQLRTMAEAEHCDLLTYLIEMAYIEASDAVRGQQSSRGGNKERDTIA